MAGLRHRLSADDYAVPGTVWHFTVVTRERQPLLVTSQTNQMVVDALEFQCDKVQSDLLVWCLMPDHLHAVIAIAEGDLIGMLRDFKSWTTRQWQRQSGQPRLWDRSFYDHGIRKTENMDHLVRYVTENPVRRGLVADWWSYPWTGGSLVQADAPG